MAKVTAPILSMRARGQIGKSQVYASWRGVPYARQLVTPANPRSAEQMLTRNTFAVLQNLWKRLGALSTAPWTAFSTGRPFTNRNAFSGQNVRALRGQEDLADYIGSPSAKGGVAPLAVSAEATSDPGEIEVTITSPPAPTGWTLQSAVAFAMQNGAPNADIPNPIQEAENNTPNVGGDTVVTLTGLTSSVEHVVSAWLVWMKPDGSTAYGASLNDTATPL